MKMPLLTTRCTVYFNYGYTPKAKKCVGIS
jgi:hypothetical protein